MHRQVKVCRQPWFCNLGMKKRRPFLIVQATTHHTGSLGVGGGVSLHCVSFAQCFRNRTHPSSAYWTEPGALKGTHITIFSYKLLLHYLCLLSKENTFLWKKRRGFYSPLCHRLNWLYTSDKMSEFFFLICQIGRILSTLTNWSCIWKILGINFLW